MASAIEDVSNLPGETIHDQDGRRIGKVKEVYGIGESDAPMWVTVEASTGAAASRIVFIPIARLKHEREQVRVPYSFQHLQSSPEIDPDQELSAEDERALRDFYAIDLADQELRAKSESYAGLVPDGEGPAKKLEGEVGEPESGKIEGEDREVNLKDPEEASGGVLDDSNGGGPSEDDGESKDDRESGGGGGESG
jgi:hypothetical protein